MEHILYWLWLTGIFGVSSGRFLPLIKHLGGIESFYKCTEYPDLNRYSLKNLQKLNNKSLVWAKKTYDTCQRKGISIIAYKDENYPEALSHIYMPPVILYARGKIPDWNNLLMISVVGTRKATEYGLRTTKTLCTGLSGSGITLVSGIAAGIDSKAIESAIDIGAFCIMVSPCGLDVNYPKSNEALRSKVVKSALMISEYPPGMEVGKWHFKDRNRIIAGLSKGTLITEAPGKSGALITARFALDENRDVFVVPGKIDDANFTGINLLLKDGAKPVFSHDDILSEYPQFLKWLTPVVKNEIAENTINEDEKLFDFSSDKPKKTPAKREYQPITKDGAEGKILRILTEDGDCHIDELIRKTECKANDFQTAVFLLELSGDIKRLPGNVFTRIK